MEWYSMEVSLANLMFYCLYTGVKTLAFRSTSWNLIFTVYIFIFAFS